MFIKFFKLIQLYIPSNSLAISNLYQARIKLNGCYQSNIKAEMCLLSQTTAYLFFPCTDDFLFKFWCLFVDIHYRIDVFPFRTRISFLWLTYLPFPQNRPILASSVGSLLDASDLVAWVVSRHPIVPTHYCTPPQMVLDGFTSLQPIISPSTRLVNGSNNWVDHQGHNHG
jgi:hypothetical protein